MSITISNFTDKDAAGFLAYWIPRSLDILFIREFFMAAGCSNILDLGCSNGFLGWLLAGDGLSVHGIDISPDIENPPFKKAELSREISDGSSLAPGDFDGVFLSWPNQGKNLAPVVLKPNPRAVVYVIETTGLTGDQEMRYIIDLLIHFRPVAYWDNINHRDLSSAIFRKEKMSQDGGTHGGFPLSSHNRVILFVRRNDKEDIATRWKKSLDGKRLPPFQWEQGLDEFFREGDEVTTGNKILWKPVIVGEEGRFISDLSMENVFY